MSFKDLLKIAILFIITSSSFGGVVFAIIKFCSNAIAERLSKKYDLKLQKEIERYKDSLDKTNYVSKIKFDFEIKVYKELFASLFNVKESVLLLFPTTDDSMPQDIDSQKEMWLDRYNTAVNNHNQYCELLSSNASFIPEEIYTGFE